MATAQFELNAETCQLRLGEPRVWASRRLGTKAGERLHGHDRVGGELNDRLEHDGELSGLSRTACTRLLDSIQNTASGRRTFMTKRLALTRARSCASICSRSASGEERPNRSRSL